MSERKKGIAVIYDPHNLYQFIWYYCTYGKEYDWTAVCLPNGYKGEYMSEFCKRSEIFEEIISDSQGYLTMSIGKKLKVFAEMFWYAIRGKQADFCKKMVSKYTKFEDYDIAVVLTDVGIVSGAFIGLSAEKKTVILEDGMGDYADRPKGYLWKHFFNPYDWQGFLVAKMGYSNPAHYYPLKTTKNCEKFCSNPDQMIYREYKSIDRLFELTNTDEKAYKEILKKVYPEIERCDFDSVDSIVFTNRLYDFCKDTSVYMEKFQKHINDNYKSIIIKKHPRDEGNYVFDEGVKVQEISNSIPAEVLLPYIKDKQIVFMFTSSILLYMQSYDFKYYYLYFEGLHKQNLEDNMFLKYVTKEEMIQYLSRFNMQDSTIIDI